MPKKPQPFSCEASFFPDSLVILIEDRYFQMIRKGDFAEILENVLTAWHFLKTTPSCRAYSHSV